jgi:hypothetical protein
MQWKTTKQLFIDISHSRLPYLRDEDKVETMVNNVLDP